MSASTEARDELLRLRADAERYRFWRRIFLRRPERDSSGAPIYTTVVQTLGDIDAQELDRILDECRKADDGVMTSFAAGELPEPEEETAPVAAPEAKTGPVTCRCGKVRPPTRGRVPRTWDCGACR